jgi:succinoglycan biosynthesis protein ExoA
MRISVIVPVRNEAASIRATLLGLVRQEFPITDFEILVVDGQSDDGTLGIVWDLQRSIPNLQVFDNPKQLASAARNIGIEKSCGEYVVIVDGHCRIDDPLFLEHHIAAFEFSGADALGRPQPLRVDDPTPFQLAVAAARASWLGHNPGSAIFSDVVRFVPADNVAVAYRRSVFEIVGRFDESFDACEDVEFNTRVRQAGLTCYFTPAIAVEYQPRATLRGLARQLARYGRGRAKLGRKHPSTISLPSLAPPLFLVWLFAGVIGFIAAPIFWAVFASISAYWLLIAAESARVWRTNADVSFRRLPLVFAAIHVGFGWGYLLETASWLTVAPGLLIRRALTPSRAQ